MNILEAEKRLNEIDSILKKKFPFDTNLRMSLVTTKTKSMGFSPAKILEVLCVTCDFKKDYECTDQSIIELYKERQELWITYEEPRLNE
jgi:hypothetical protein